MNRVAWVTLLALAISVPAYCRGLRGGWTSSRSSQPRSHSGGVRASAYRTKLGKTVRSRTRSYPGTAMQSAPRAPVAARSSPATATPSRVVARPGTTSPRLRLGPAQRTRSSSSVRRDSQGRIERSSAARAAFMRTRPCPTTWRTFGACPGFVVDHIVPLKRGGADSPSNMQWQPVAAARAKDRIE
jgi:hypothetical protein